MIELKTVNPFFSDIWNKKKTFEIRFNDRDFKVGQEVVLLEYPTDKPRKILIKIDYIVADFAGLTPGYICFGFTEKAREFDPNKPLIPKATINTTMNKRRPSQSGRTKTIF